MKKLGQVVPGALGRESVLRTARAQRTMRHWEDVVGTSMAARSWPERFEKGTLWVAVEGSAWAQELRMSKDRILARLTTLSGEKEVFLDIRFGVRQRPEPKEVLPTKADKDALKEALSGLTIREIADRRLLRWRDEEPT